MSKLALLNRVRSHGPSFPQSFDGVTIFPEDEARLSGQLRRVKFVMLDGEWRTLDQIGSLTGAPPASVSARLRDLRKVKFGGYDVQRRRRARGIHEYRLGLEGASGAGVPEEWEL